MRSRRIEFDWKVNEVIKLISAVHDRRRLWDIHASDYRLPKDDLWREVVAEVGCSNITINEVRAKWSALRVTYKTNKHKRDQKMAAEGLTEPPKVPWRHFDSMQFLESKYTDESKNSTTKLRKMSLPSPSSIIFNELDNPVSPKQETQMKRKRKYSTNSSRSDPLSMENEHFIENTMSTMATNDMSSMYHNENGVAASDLIATDRNTSFCQHILAELQALSEVNAFALRRTLNRAMWDFLEAVNYGTPMQQQRQQQHTIVPDRG